MCVCMHVCVYVCALSFTAYTRVLGRMAHNPLPPLLQYGEVFSFTMVGKTFTYLVGPNASAVFFNSKNSDLNAEEVYSKLVTPVFGKGVAYDVPNSIFLEQKKMLKAGLTLAHFRRYTPMVEKETQEYFKRWGDEGEKGEGPGRQWYVYPIELSLPLRW